MKKNNKKLIAPIVIVSIMVLYYGIFILMLCLFKIPLIAKILGLLIPLSIISVAIYALVERIKEIRSGEEDDLSKY